MQRENQRQRRLGLHGSGCEGENLVTATDHVAGNAADKPGDLREHQRANPAPVCRFQSKTTSRTNFQDMNTPPWRDEGFLAQSGLTRHPRPNCPQIAPEWLGRPRFYVAEPDRLLNGGADWDAASLGIGQAECGETRIYRGVSGLRIHEQPDRPCRV